MIDDLVDTGATGTAIPASMARQLGLTVVGQVTSNTAGGVVQGTVVVGDVELQGGLRVKRLRMTALPNLDKPLLGGAVDQPGESSELSAADADADDDTSEDTVAEVATYGDTSIADEATSEEVPADETSVPDESPVGSPFIPAAAAAVAEATPAPVDEPAGWASAPEQAIETPVLAADASIADLAAQVSEPETVVATEPVVAVVAEPEVAPAAESTVPAGWYADPSGRFELRYWDGAAWTEHVSRAGQQFTDPPVA